MNWTHEDDLRPMKQVAHTGREKTWKFRRKIRNCKKFISKGSIIRINYRSNWLKETAIRKLYKVIVWC